MKFTEDQIDFVSKILSEEDIEEEVITKIKQKLSSIKKEKVKASDTTSITTETCIATTKVGKRCSKKPTKGEQMCSIHLKKPSDTSSVKSTESTPEADKMTEEEKKRQIELIFEQNN